MMGYDDGIRYPRFSMRSTLPLEWKEGRKVRKGRKVKEGSGRKDVIGRKLKDVKVRMLKEGC